jgi:hypothetical protein
VNVCVHRFLIEKAILPITFIIHDSVACVRMGGVMIMSDRKTRMLTLQRTLCKQPWEGDDVGDDPEKALRWASLLQYQEVVQRIALP